ncbi:MAG: ABC transporter permease [Patescibacteria group bacterium]|nr:ABC transporter permease [Patescibacteria group bacterium]
MKLRHTFITAVAGLRANKARSGLTILGIVIGITAIILVMSVGEGAKLMILDQVRIMGSRTIEVEPGRTPKGASDMMEIYTDSLRPRDVVALLNPANVPGLEELTPVVMKVETIAYGTETKRTTVMGASELIAEIMKLKVARGMFFSDEDIRSRAAVAVIGPKVKEKLFGASDALGQKIRIKNRVFRVVGELAPKGSTFFTVDEMVMVPYTTAQDYLLGIDYYHAIMVQAKTEELVPQVKKDIERTLREVHGITDPEKDDFHATTQADAIAIVGIITTILTVLLTSVAAVSLVVGGIGIMNIMLVSVTERTREVGLRKAIGATEGDILRQFLFESVALTGVGGLIGIALGALLSFLTTLVLRQFVSSGWGFSLPISAVILGVGVSTAVGVVFGLYPASIAARKNPIEALRYE